MMARGFDDLVAEAATAPVEGWDFSWLDGRATEQRPSWGYQRLMAEHLAGASAALDIQTGGGEVLAGAAAFPPTMVATESWPPNVARATKLLVVHFLRKVIWTVPDYTIDRYRDRLRQLHKRIEMDGPFVAHSSRTLIDVRKAG